MKKKVKLDETRLLGFRLYAAHHMGAKVGAKVGRKTIGAKIGNKTGIKVT